jgi:hypothetical protein
MPLNCMDGMAGSRFHYLDRFSHFRWTIDAQGKSAQATRSGTGDMSTDRKYSRRPMERQDHLAALWPMRPRVQCY